MMKCLALALSLIAPAAAWADTPPAGTYTYVVEHPDHGEIGTYTNVIQPAGDRITVESQFKVRVGIGPLTLYREEADRREEWEDGRLVSYVSKSVKNGEDRLVEGRAEGDRFIVRSGDRTREAPAGVWPMNPWSPELIDAQAVLTWRSGKVHPAQVADVGMDTITLNGKPIEARHYRLKADDETYDIWFDAEGRLARFTAPEKGGAVMFTLVESP